MTNSGASSNTGGNGGTSVSGSASGGSGGNARSGSSGGASGGNVVNGSGGSVKNSARSAEPEKAHKHVPEKAKS